MANKSTGRPVGRPVGTRTATVELETVSFKAPKEFVEQVKRYAKQRSRPVSELVRDGLEWRIGEGDPLNIRYGTVASGETAYEGNTSNTDMPEGGVEALHGMLVDLLVEVRQLRESMRIIEQRLGEPGRMQVPSVTGNTSMASGDGDMPVAIVGAQSTSGHAPAGGGEGFDPARFRLGKLCKREHAYHGTGQTLYRLPRFVCPECDAEGARERRKAKRAVAVGEV